MIDYVTCPYCNKEIAIELEDFEDGFLTQDECPECGKVLNITPNVTVDFEVSKCECQLENHKWKLTNAFPKCFRRWECEYCGQTKELTDKERDDLGITQE